MTGTERKRRGPKPTGKGVQVVVRLHDPMLSAIDKIRMDSTMPAQPSRAEIIRYILLDWLVSNGYIVKPGDTPGDS